MHAPIDHAIIDRCPKLIKICQQANSIYNQLSGISGNTNSIVWPWNSMTEIITVDKH